MTTLDILVPVLMGTALLWWYTRSLSWTRRLAVAAVTLAVVVVIVIVDRYGYWPDVFRR